MQPHFWHERWRTGQIGFHKAAPDPFLGQFWPRLGLPAGSAAFVPLCGKSVDLIWLRLKGHRVNGVEISPIALESFLLEQGVNARRRTDASFDIYESDGLTLFGGDFFSLNPCRLGPISAVYDRAALISWNPDMRGAYVKHMHQLTNPGTQTLLVATEYSQTQMSGPPFSVDADEVDRLYGPNHSIRELARIDILSGEPRLQARGLKQLFEVCYLLIRED